MKKMLVLVISLTVVLMLVSYSAFAADWVPNQLKLSADPVIQYAFDGTALKIPVTVSGTYAGTTFLVYTKGKASEIPDIQNGFLGWHQVNKVDTCIYMSPLTNLAVGTQDMTWSGKDNDGGVVPSDDYTYYLWAFDNQGAKDKVSQYWMGSYERRSMFQELDEAGLPLAIPWTTQIYSGITKVDDVVVREKHINKYFLGNDPMDSTLIESTDFADAEGWAVAANYIVYHPDDFDYYYYRTRNAEAENIAVNKFKWVPNGMSEFQTDFGEEGYGAMLSRHPDTGTQPSAVTDGDYLYTAYACWRNCTEAVSDFFIVDFDGTIIDEIDMSPWWSRPDEYQPTGGVIMNGGPITIHWRNDRVYLNCHCACIKQAVSPTRYMESGDDDDFYIWTNQNGDYVLDKNFDETADAPWTCMTGSVGPYDYIIWSDDNDFSVCPAYDAGAVSYGLMGPDGTGIGYMSFAGETSGWKQGLWFVDEGTPYDGLYCDNWQAGGTHYQEGGFDSTNPNIQGLFFVGQDSIKGVITSGVGVDASAPAAFDVDQCVPNPANPTTTISFTLAEAGNVNVEVYNVAGQKVDTIVDTFMDAGRHSIFWDGSDFSTGVYFYTVKSNGHSKTMKMTLLK